MVLDINPPGKSFFFLISLNSNYSFPPPFNCLNSCKIKIFEKKLWVNNPIIHKGFHKCVNQDFNFFFFPRHITGVILHNLKSLLFTFIANDKKTFSFDENNKHYWTWRMKCTFILSEELYEHRVTLVWQKLTLYDLLTFYKFLKNF